MSVIGDLSKELVAEFSTPSGWQTLSTASNYYDNAVDAATDFLLDLAIQNRWLREAYKGVMLFTNSKAVGNNNGLTNKFVNGKNVPTWLQTTESVIGGILGAVMDADTVALWLSTGFDENGFGHGMGGAAGESWEKVLMQPNIGGVPISSSSVSTDRTVDISEQMLIVQDSKQKQYWTDNAVPRLKEWIVDGYITSVLKVDQKFMIKPSLDFQAQFLDRCAVSRRPVLFKTNRGEFIFVQITNLKTTQDASYNNAIKVTISLKEFNPYEVADISTIAEDANKPQVTGTKPSSQEVLDKDPMGGVSKKTSLTTSGDVSGGSSPVYSAKDKNGTTWSTQPTNGSGWTIYPFGAQYGFDF